MHDFKKVNDNKRSICLLQRLQGKSRSFFNLKKRKKEEILLELILEAYEMQDSLVLRKTTGGKMPFPSFYGLVGLIFPSAPCGHGMINLPFLSTQLYPVSSPQPLGKLTTAMEKERGQKCFFTFFP